MPDPQSQETTDQVVEACSTAIGRKVLGRDLSPREFEALKSILGAAAQALSEGFIERLATHVLSERKEETIEEFFEDQVKTD